MKINILSFLFFLLLTSCSNKEKEVLKSNTIYIELKNIPKISDTLKINKTRMLISHQPNISYKVNYDFKDYILDNITEKDFTNFKIIEDTIYLKLRYRTMKSKTFVLYKNDSVIINFNKKLPYIEYLNREYKKFDYGVEDILIKKEQPKDFFSFFEENKRFPNKKELDSIKIKKNNLYEEKIKWLDSIYKKGLISKKNYNYKRTNIFYSLNRTDEKIKEIIKGNNDLHIGSYCLMLKDFISNNIKNKVISVSNGNVINSKESFDYVISNDTLFTQKAKDFLMHTYLKSIATDFSIEDFKSRFNIFSNITSNKELIAEIKDEFLLDYSEINEMKNDVFLIDKNKRKITLKEFIKKNKNKYIYIDFWASWCSPCREELPFSRKIIDEYKDDEILFVFISIDKNFKKWKKATENEKIDKYSFLAINYPNAKFYRDLELKTIPRYLLFNKQGKIIHTNLPKPSSLDLKKVLNKYLKKE